MWKGFGGIHKKVGNNGVLCGVTGLCRYHQCPWWAARVVFAFCRCVGLCVMGIFVIIVGAIKEGYLLGGDVWVLDGMGIACRGTLVFLLGGVRREPDALNAGRVI